MSGLKVCIIGALGVDTELAEWMYCAVIRVVWSVFALMIVHDVSCTMSCSAIV
jgi:hypothetical protein